MTQQITIDAEGMSDSEIAGFRKEFEAAVNTVRDWWGPTFDGDFTVRIEDSRGPSMALVPAWRGEHGTILFRTQPTLKGRSALIHEVTHIFAPNANRFLAEGLAVFAQELLSDRIATPSFGKDMHALAAKSARMIDLPALADIVTPRRLQIEGRIDQFEAYIAAGSFVRFLVETRGLDTFREIYALTPLVPGEWIESDPGRWQPVYGEPFRKLQEQWVQHVARQ